MGNVVDMSGGTLTAIQNACMNETPMEEEELKKVFQALDPESKGHIPADEFIKSLQIFGGDQAFTTEELAILKTEMGRDESGHFNFLEFLDLRKVQLGRKL